MTKSAWEVAAAAEREAGALREQVGHGRSLVRRHRAGTQALQERLDAAHEELATLLLPSLEPADIARAGAVVGSRGGTIAGTDPLRGLEEDRVRLVRRIGQIDVDPRWTNRQSLRDPVVGSLPRDIAELDEAARPLRAKMQRARHERLEHLLDSQYGTEAYPTPFWRLGYYQDWKAGDEILEQFPDHQSFGTLRAELLETKDALATLEWRLSELRRELETGEALEAERTTAESDLANIRERHLTRTRKRLVGALADLPVEEIARRVSNDPTTVALLKRIAGQREQLRYLDELEVSVLKPLVDRAGSEAARMERDSMKWRRPKMSGRRVSDEEFASRTNRTAKLQKGWDRYDRAYSSVVGFDRYDAGRWGTDFLWWDIITHGDRGHYVPSVAMFRTEHPEWRMPHDEDAEADAAAAALSTDRRHARDDTWHDAS